MKGAQARLPVSIVIPARNEEQMLPATLAAAARSGAEEILVVDDGSTDATPQVIEAWSRRDGRVRRLAAGGLPAGWTGKNHAVWQGAKAAGQPWLLFLDADTRLLAGGLEGAWAWAVSEKLDALSLSPEQEMETYWERAVQPAVFLRLGRAFPFDDVNDAAHPAAAANGQFILIRREVYFAVGGHRELRGEVLEDVELARRIKQAGHRFAFRSGQGWVRTRMYRDLGSLWQGWSKNLYLLLGAPGPRGMAACFWPLLLLAVAGACGVWEWWRAALGLAGIIGVAHLLYAAQLRRAGWRGARYLIPGWTLMGLMWVNSARSHRRTGRVQWKGRAISVAAGADSSAGVVPSASATPRVE